jgi:type I restriction enzyme, S subunit
VSYFQHSGELPAWIGSPPARWGTDWLKWHVRLLTERPTDEEAEELPYIANEDISSWTGKLLNSDPQPANADSRKFQPDDVLFNKLRPYLAKVYHASFAGVSSGELLCLRAEDRVLPRYLFYVVSSKAFVDTVNAETFGSKMPRADWETVGHQPLPRPPIESQRRISVFLDEKTAQIDALIDKKQALLDRLAEKRQAIITQAVTKGLNPATQMKESGVDWLGQIPAHWEVKPLKRVKKYLTSGSRDWAEYYADEGEIFLRMTNVTKGGVEIDSTDLRHVNLEGVSEGKRTVTRAGDILITITAELGSVAIVREAHSGSYINQHLALFRCDPTQCDPDFLVNYLWSQVTKEQFVLSGQGGTKQGLGFDQVDGVIIALPPLHEQRAIAQVVRSHREHLDAAETAIAKSIDVLAEYRSALITAAVTGQIEGLR